MSDDQLSTSRSVAVVVAAGNQPGPAIDAAIRPFLSQPPLSHARSVVLAVANPNLARERNGAPRLLAAMLRSPDRAVRIVAPPHTLAGAFVSRRGAHRWTPLPVSPAAMWLDRAWMIESLATTSPVVLVNHFEENAGSDSPVIGAWSRFAHPRQRLAAYATGRREGIAAELASAVHPALVLLIAQHLTMTLAVATADQIAAELVALALRNIWRSPAREDDQCVGPWEDPLIQRATELGLGATWPGAIRLHAIWTSASAADQSAQEDLLALVERVRARLGLPHPVAFGAPRP